MFKIALFILVIYHLRPTCCQSHFGKSFIFGIPHNIKDEQQCKTVLISIASPTLGNYSLSIPFLNKSETGPIEKFTEIMLPCSITRFGNFSENRGIYLNTSHDVSVYATNYYKNTAESFLVLPASEVGRHYVVAAYEPYVNTGTRFVMVVATRNKTNGYLKDGYSLQNFTLNQLDVYQFTTFRRIQGISFNLDKPVTVISGTTCANIPHEVSACDTIFEQMVPFTALDNIYIVPPTPPKKAYELKVTHFNSSSIDLTCFYNISYTKPYCTSDPTVLIRMGTSPTVVKSNNTISVVQFGFGNGYPETQIGDPFMTVIQGLRNFLNSYHFVIPSVYSEAQNHISVIINKADLNGLLLDGTNVTEMSKDIFNVSKPLNKYIVLIISVSSGYHNIKHANENVMFGLQVYGLGALTNTFVGFGYPGGMKLSMFDEITLSTVSSQSTFKDLNSINPDEITLSTVSSPSTSKDVNSTVSEENTFSTESSPSMLKDVNSANSDSLGIILGSVFGVITVLSTVGCMLLFFIFKRKKLGKSSVQPEKEVTEDLDKGTENENDSDAMQTGGNES